MPSLSKHMVISGIPSGSVFTKRLLADVTDRLEAEPICYNAFLTPPLPCDGCGYCKHQAACKHRDLDDFFANFAAAEHIILAFPVYNNSFPAPLKALLDRFQQYYYARFVRNMRPPMSGKRTVTLVMTMGSNRDVTPLILEQLRPIFTICGCRLGTSIVLTGTDHLLPTDALTPIVTHYES